MELSTSGSKPSAPHHWLPGFGLCVRRLNDTDFRLTDSIFFTQGYFYVIETQTKSVYGRTAFNDGLIVFDASTMRRYIVWQKDWKQKKSL